MLKLKLQYFVHLMQRVDSFEKTLMLGLGAGGEGDDRGWDGWVESPSQWTWVWVNSGNWWWTGRPGMLWFLGSQRVGHDWVTELNWTDRLTEHWKSRKVLRDHPVPWAIIWKINDAQRIECWRPGASIRTAGFSDDQSLREEFSGRICSWHWQALWIRSAPNIEREKHEPPMPSSLVYTAWRSGLWAQMSGNEATDLRKQTACGWFSSALCLIAALMMFAK